MPRLNIKKKNWYRYTVYIFAIFLLYFRKLFMPTALHFMLSGRLASYPVTQVFNEQNLSNVNHHRHSGNNRLRCAVFTYHLCFTLLSPSLSLSLLSSHCYSSFLNSSLSTPLSYRKTRTKIGQNILHNKPSRQKNRTISPKV